MSFTTIDDFELGKCLGIGQFGQVWLAKHKRDGYVCAIKIIDLACIKENKQVKNIRREIEIHLNMQHKNIIAMYGYFYDSKSLYCVLEYTGVEDLYGLLERKGKLDEKTTKKYIRDIALAIEYLHSENIIHRDIKPENILVSFDDDLKLGDFGWAVYNGDKRRGTFCGTVDYLSPELCENKTHDKEVDIWCIGILCYELLTGKTPFVSSDRSQRATQKLIVSSNIVYPPYLSPTAIDFISLCTNKDQTLRPSITELLKHTFINS